MCRLVNVTETKEITFDTSSKKAVTESKEKKKNVSSVKIKLKKSLGHLPHPGSK